MVRTSIVLASLATTVQAGVPLETTATRYKGQSVIRVSARDERAIRLLDALSGDRWSCGGLGVNNSVDYRVPASDLDGIRVAGVQFEIVIPDLQVVIDRERDETRLADRAGWSFASFPDAATTSLFIDDLVSSYPDFATRLSFGTSIEGREIYGIRMTSPAAPAAGSNRKPVIVINALQHAREWITLTTSLYIAQQLLQRYSMDAVIKRILDQYELVVIPIVNPDGFNITWGPDRYWRKNARRVTTQQILAGVDLNRNWSVGWGLNNGSSPSYTNDTYRGTAPFSEPETRALRDYMVTIPKLVAHVDIHSYASDILRPWSYQWQTPPAYPALMRIGSAMATEVKKLTGLNYAVGGPEILYLSSGTAPDWSYGTAGCISYTIEMNNASGGGFSPPASSIVASGIQGLIAVRTLVDSLCRSDFNYDNVVDDADFALFVGAYDVLLSNEGDLTGDGMTDDSDFSLFVQAYDKLTCP